ncbi:MAG: MBL fold metallo-hydrolase [Nocardioides sp.]|uniref:MBL fold metallo-hydrolase n=1 Tax=Nocardioides sp. TaxID=35761 RepID=UPI0039E6F124
MSNLHVHHLNCAHVTTMKLGGAVLACHVLVVETPDSGLVLVDTGLGTADYADISSRLGWSFAHLYARPAVDRSLAAIEQIRAMGLDPHDVRHIVQTHLDLDHVGGLSDFPWAKVHVHATELAAARARKGTKARGRYRPGMWAHGPNWQTYAAEGDPWFGFEAVRSLSGLPEEILFVPLAGHTMGHCGVAIDTDEGWLLNAGDAYFDPREVHQEKRECAVGVGMFQRVVTTDKALRFHNQDRLRAFIAEHPEVAVFSAHDPGAAPFGPVRATSDGVLHRR